MFFFFKDTATTEIYTLSLHDALPISLRRPEVVDGAPVVGGHYAVYVLVRPEDGQLKLALGEGQCVTRVRTEGVDQDRKSTPSELQSRQYLVCRLLLEKKTKNTTCEIR